MISDPKPVSHPLDGLKGWGQKIKIQLFQGHGHVVNQIIKGKHECSNMVTNILLAEPPIPP